MTSLTNGRDGRKKFSGIKDKTEEIGTLIKEIVKSKNFGLRTSTKFVTLSKD